MRSPLQRQHLINYLSHDLGIPYDSLKVGIRHCHDVFDRLPVVLWQYGLVSLTQLEEIFDWLEQV